MTKKVIWLIALTILAAGLVLAGFFYNANLRGVWPALRPAPADITEFFPPATSTDSLAAPAGGQTDAGPLKLPAGFKISILAKDLPGARVIIFDAAGNMWLSQTRLGQVAKLTLAAGRVAEQKTVFSGLKNPHGLAFDPKDNNLLFIAEENQITKADLSRPGAPRQKIIDLPRGGNHFTRTLGFGPDGRLYVSIGSTCNVCYETDPRYAAIYSLKKDGTDFRLVAQGLRNAVFFVWRQADGKMWATNMGRDLLGDDLPPDTVNVIDTASGQSQNFGWPVCYGKNVHDADFDKNQYIANPCAEPSVRSSRVDLPAHSAPLGLAFVPENSAWPAEYRQNLIIAFHGSWNRSTPTGYKVVRLILDQNGELVAQKDFITGFLTAQGALGRPVDVIFDAAGALYVSDDKAGVIYRVDFQK